jgi:hypothetical protein
MCTVTFIPSNQGIILTSNRDEKHWRAAATPPEIYSLSSGRIIFPKDGDAGGSWIAIHQNGNAVIFLNGGFVSHVPQPPYRKSRGLILLDLINNDAPIRSFEKISLEGIEPFTAVIWCDEKLFECRWDGRKKYQVELPRDVSHIWSSATLYDGATVTKRKIWFDEWLQTHPNPNQDEIMHFHQFTGDGDQHNDLMMNRDGKVFTVSVTSAFIGGGKIHTQYLDVKTSAKKERHLHIINPTMKA